MSYRFFDQTKIDLEEIYKTSKDLNDLLGSACTNPLLKQNLSNLILEDKDLSRFIKTSGDLCIIFDELIMPISKRAFTNKIISQDSFLETVIKCPQDLIVLAELLPDDADYQNILATKIVNNKALLKTMDIQHYSTLFEMRFPIFLNLYNKNLLNSKCNDGVDLLSSICSSSLLSQH